MSIAEGVFSLMPGEVLQARVEAEGITIRISKWHTLENSLSANGGKPQSREEAVTGLRTALEESVRLHLVSDVPLGVFLSGGMDSSALVALMSRVHDQRPKTFSVVFEEQQFSETRHSRFIADRFKTDHSEVRLSEERLLRMLPEAISSLDQPTMDGINTFVVSGAVKAAGVTVALSGLGGDELFAGYPSFRRALKVGSLNGVQRTLLKTFSGSAKSFLKGSVRRRKFWELAASNGGPEIVYRISRELFSLDEIARLIPESAAVNGPARLDGNGSTDIVNAISRLELEGYMANTLLRDTDSMSMAHSLEVRVPFIDLDVVHYVMSLPGEWKFQRPKTTVPKAMLADAISDLLPLDFLKRPKMGFSLPFEKWMQSALRHEISGILEGSNTLRPTGLNREAVRNVWKQFSRSPQSIGWSRPWALFVLAKWCRVNNVGF
jgi:asparagine synthase (glutamine-hydrolysing)